MTTRGILIVIGAIVGALALLVLIFVGGIIGIALYSINNSDAAVTAREFLRNNERLRQDIGEVRDFGMFVSGSVSVSHSGGTATLGMKVIGKERTVNATVELLYSNGRPWRVTSASYADEGGQTIDLLNAYESRTIVPPPGSFL